MRKYLVWSFLVLLGLERGSAPLASTPSDAGDLDGAGADGLGNVRVFGDGGEELAGFLLSCPA